MDGTKQTWHFSGIHAHASLSCLVYMTHEALLFYEEDCYWRPGLEGSKHGYGVTAGTGMRSIYLETKGSSCQEKKIKSCFVRGARFPSKSSYRSRSKSWSACLGPSLTLPTSQTYIYATWRTRVLLWPLLPALPQEIACPWPAMVYSEMRLN